jgi:GntP family gluconate:H+ symporter
VLRSIAELPEKPFGAGPVIGLLGFLGQPVVALLIGVALATLLPKKLDRAMLSSGGWVGEAILAAATIIIITGAGGAFGKVLQNSGIAKIIGENLTGSPMGILLPFVIAAGIKTAQGSSTVAIITTASLVAPLLASLGLDSDTAKALVVVAIGAGVDGGLACQRQLLLGGDPVLRHGRADRLPAANPGHAGTGYGGGGHCLCHQSDCALNA